MSVCVSSWLVFLLPSCHMVVGGLASSRASLSPVAGVDSTDTHTLSCTLPPLRLTMVWPGPSLLMIVVLCCFFLSTSLPSVCVGFHCCVAFPLLLSHLKSNNGHGCACALPHTRPNHPNLISGTLVSFFSSVGVFFTCRAAAAKSKVNAKGPYEHEPNLLLLLPLPSIYIIPAVDAVPAERRGGGPEAHAKRTDQTAAFLDLLPLLCSCSPLTILSP